MLLAAEACSRPYDRDTLGTALLAGLFAALSDHKLVVLAAAVLLWEALRLEGQNLGRRLSAAVRHPLVIGFALGTLFFWIYGAAVNPRAFWLDHVERHLLDRILRRHTIDPSQYPNLPQMWWEFTLYTGGGILFLGGWSLAVLCFGNSPRSKHANGSMPAGWRQRRDYGPSGC